MTRDEIRSLIGGYATGSLSAAERAALFEAALEDQELFDELAREHALKELLDELGVKARLVAALAPRHRPWWANATWNKSWAWAAAGAFAIAVIAGIVLLEKPQAPEIQTARLTVPALPGPPPAVPSVVAPPPVVSPLVVSPPVISPPPISPPAISKEAAPMAPLPAPNPAPKLGTGPIAAPAPASLAEPAPAAPAPVQAPVQTTASIAALGAVVGGVPAGVGGGGGGRGGAARPLARAATSRFAFDYKLMPEGVLRIEPASVGFLTVGVSNSAGSYTALFLDRPVQPGSVNEVVLPADAVSARVVFAFRPGSSPASLATGAMDPPSGTKFDPNPSPSTVLVAVFPVQR